MNDIVTVGTTTPTELKGLGIPDEKLKSILRKMVLARRFEEKVEELYLKMALITGPCHLYLGMEAIAAGAAEALTVDDYVLATYRGHGHAVTRDAPLDKVFAELMGRVDGTCKGLGGSMHAATWTEKKLMLATAIVGSNIPIAAGMGLAVKKKGLDAVVVAYFGDGAVNSGSFNEGVNLAAVWKVPAIFVCENNQYAMSLPEARGVASKSIAERAAAYDIPTFVADGNDPVSVYRAMKEARGICRRGDGPCFIEARTYRMKGHGIYDKADYRPSDEVREWAGKDPIAMFSKLLVDQKVLSEKEYGDMRSTIDNEIEAAVKKARASPYPEFSTLQGMVYPE
ncbi:MAG: thiamine pyrophosphate-dependent dehydrogenase E1 component subunit alpha [Nitrososphaerales archaeon]|nr:thiamine pyrophosphate-dependent dehydrogenase E1 component subunit alpha [Nitrososphaerales archaeon]